MALKYLTIAFFFCFQAANAQSDSTIYFKEIGWRINLPADYKILDNNLVSKKVYMKTLLSATKTGGDLFNVAYDSSNLLTIENWQDFDKAGISSILKAMGFKNVIAHKEYNGVFQIEGIKFKEFEVDYAMRDSSILHLMFLSSFYMNRYILLNYFFQSDPEEIFNMVDKSKFDR